MEQMNRPEVRTTTTTLNARNGHHLFSMEQAQIPKVTLHETLTMDGVNRTDQGRMSATLRPPLLQYTQLHKDKRGPRKIIQWVCTKNDKYVNGQSQHTILQTNKHRWDVIKCRLNRWSCAADQTTIWNINMSGLCQDATRPDLWSYENNESAKFSTLSPPTMTKRQTVHCRPYQASSWSVITNLVADST